MKKLNLIVLLVFGTLFSAQAQNYPNMETCALNQPLKFEVKLNEVKLKNKVSGTDPKTKESTEQKSEINYLIQFTLTSRTAKEFKGKAVLLDMNGKIKLTATRTEPAVDSTFNTAPEGYLNAPFWVTIDENGRISEMKPEKEDTPEEIGENIKPTVQLVLPLATFVKVPKGQNKDIKADITDATDGGMAMTVSSVSNYNYVKDADTLNRKTGYLIYKMKEGNAKMGGGRMSQMVTLKINSINGIYYTDLGNGFPAYSNSITNMDMTLDFSALAKELDGKKSKKKKKKGEEEVDLSQMKFTMNMIIDAEVRQVK